MPSAPIIAMAGSRWVQSRFCNVCAAEVPAWRATGGRSLVHVQVASEVFASGFGVYCGSN